MKFARATIDGTPVYGRIEGEQFVPLPGLPYAADAATASAGAPVPLADLRLLAPVEPGKIFGIGRNYAAHASEMGLATADSPSVFMKPPNSVIGPGDACILPDPAVESNTQHEGELVVVIGTPARHVSEADAFDVIFGYTCGNDVSARDSQKADPQITRGKGFDTFCPLGPVIETDLDLEAGVRVQCAVNGEMRQDGHTRELLFSVPTLIAWLSAWTTLLPGDIIMTGSPSGTGPMAPGDLVEVTVEGIGTLAHTVQAAT